MSAQEGSLCPFVKNGKPVLQSIQWNIFSYITETMTKTIWSYPYQVLLISNLHIHEYQTELKIIAKWQTLSFVCHSINDLENSFYKLTPGPNDRSSRPTSWQSSRPTRIDSWPSPKVRKEFWNLWHHLFKIALIK